MAVRGGLYILTGELDDMIQVMKTGGSGVRAHRESNSWNSDSMAEMNPLLSKFFELKDTLSNITDLCEIELCVFLQPFLDVIRSADTTGLTTGAALFSVNKFICCNMIDSSSTDISGAVASVADAVTHARFVGTDPSRDEVVLMQILQVLRTLMLAPCGSYLTNESVCEILQSCFRICFETRLSELLRKTSEHTLADMIKVLFSRLPGFKEDSAGVGMSVGKLKMKSTGGRKGGKQKITKRSEGAIPGGSKKQKYKHFARSADDISAMNALPKDDKKEITELQSPVAEEITVVQRERSKSELGKRIEQAEEEGCDDEVKKGVVVSSLKKSMSEPDLVDADEIEASVGGTGAEAEIEGEEFAMVDIAEEDSTGGDHSDSASNVTGNDFVNPRGIRFTQEVHLYDEDTVTLIPHGLPCVREVLRFLISLINPYDSHNHEHMIQISLSLLTVAMEVASDSIANFSSLLKLAREELCKHLFSLLYNRRFQLVLPSLRLSFLLFESIRGFLKLQMECYLLRIMDLMNSDVASLDIKEKAIDFLVKLFKVPGFAAELYINYDCDVYCSNLFEDLTKLLSKNAFPVSGLQNYHVLSLDALLALIDTVSAHCNHSQSSPHHGYPPVPSALEGDRVDIARMKERKKHLETGTDMFNHKPREGVEYLQAHGFLSTPLDLEEVAKHLRENWRLDKKMIGEYISDKRVSQLLTHYISTFNFANVRIDEALRSFLESFRLPGEAPVISYILEAFSHQWHETNGRPFANDDAVYILAYAIVMLNTDQHNPQAKKQNIPMSMSAFKSQVRGVNGGSDFDGEMIEQIYQAIKSKEIVLPTEQSGPLKENYIWKQLEVRSSTGAVMPYMPAHDGAYNLHIFSLVWGSTVAALSFVFDKSLHEKTIMRSINGFRKCAQIAAFYGCGDVFDNLVISLCKFTTLVNINTTSAEGPHLVPYYFGLNAKAQLAAKTMFQLAHNQGDTLREGWKNIVDCLQNLFKCRLLPSCMVEVEDFLEPSGKISLLRDDSASQRLVKNDSTGLLSSFYSYFAGGSVDSQSSKGTSAEDQEALQQAKSCIVECKPEQLITESKFLQEESLLELVKALRFASQGPEARLGEGVFEQDLAVFNLEVLIQVAIQNRDRISLIWSQISQHLSQLISEAKTCTFLVQRAVIGLLRLCTRLLHLENVASEAVQSLKVLLFTEPKVMKVACRHIAYGLHELIKTNAANVHQADDWQVLLALIQTAGTGVRFVKYSTPAEIEAVAAASKPQSVGCKTREVVAMGCLGQYVIKDKERLGVNDVKAFGKCWHSMVLIVQDTAHVTPYNLESCSNALKCFAEACSSRRQMKKQQAAPNSSKANSGSHQKRGNSGASTRSGKSTGKSTWSSPESLNINVQSEDEEDDLSASQVDVITQLLIRIEELHSRAPKMLKLWAAESSSAEGDVTDVVDFQLSFPLWQKCWLPLLQAIGCLCCDSRRHVRMDALGRLQRCLLTHEMLCLSCSEWESCFNVVFLPTLHQLLEPSISPGDAVGMEETRMRAASTLSKVFLQRLNTLLGLPNFLDLWVDILQCMKKYMVAEDSELLAEAIPESLKNILLVMHTARLFEYRSQFTILTWQTLDEFLPHLQTEILSNPSMVTSTQDPSTLSSSSTTTSSTGESKTTLPSQENIDGKEETNQNDAEKESEDEDAHVGVILHAPLPEDDKKNCRLDLEGEVEGVDGSVAVTPVIIPTQCGNSGTVMGAENRAQELTAE